MRTIFTSSRWFVPLAAAAFLGCGASVDSTTLSESASECVAEPEAMFVTPSPDPETLPGPLMSSEVAKPELGPITDLLILPRDLGHACELGPECASGVCSDGVCCDMPCAGSCQACNLPGKVGFCWAHPAGTDPELGCGAPGCHDGVQQVFSCDGAGSCQVAMDPCSPYLCGVDACLDACRDDADCAERASCVGSTCLAD